MFLHLASAVEFPSAASWQQMTATFKKQAIFKSIYSAFKARITVCLFICRVSLMFGIIYLKRNKDQLRLVLNKLSDSINYSFYKTFFFFFFLAYKVQITSCQHLHFKVLEVITSSNDSWLYAFYLCNLDWKKLILLINIRFYNFLWD